MRSLRHVSLPSLAASLFTGLRAVTVLAAVVLFLSAALPARGQFYRTLRADKGPGFVFGDSARGLVHLFTVGEDLNFNYILDPGETSARWFVIDAKSEQIIDSLTFDGLFNSWPLRPGIDTVNRRIYLPILGGVSAYDLDTRELLSGSVMQGNFSSVGYDPIGNVLALGIRPDYTSNGSVLFMDPTTGREIGTATVGVVPSMTVAVSDPVIFAPAYYTLNEGSFGQSNSTLTRIAFNTDVYRSVNGGNLGAGATAVLANEDQAFIAETDAGLVRVFDTETHKELDFSPISVLDGEGSARPSSLALQDATTLLVGTGAGDVRRFDLSTGLPIDTFDFPSGVSSIAVRGTTLFAAFGLTPPAGPGTMVVAVDLGSGTVTDTLTTAGNPGAYFLDARGDLNIVGHRPADGQVWWNTYGSDGDVTTERILPYRYDPVVPLDAAYDATRDSLYIVLYDTLFAFPAVGASPQGRMIYTAPKIRSVVDAGEYLLLAEMKLVSGVNESWVHIVDKSTGVRVVRLRTLDGLTRLAPVTSWLQNSHALYALTAGGSGSSLMVVDYSHSILGNIGGGGNHIALYPPFGLVTMNGSHEILAVNFAEPEVTKTYETGTEGMNGPRESMLAGDDDILTTTYTGDLRIIDKDGSYHVRKIVGKGEGLAVVEGKVFIANSLITGTYLADSTMTILDRTALSVSREEAQASVVTLEQNVPNPVVDRTVIRFTLDRSAHVRLNLYSANGELVGRVADEEMEEGVYTADLNVDELPAGTYIYVLDNGFTRLSRTMQVVK